MFAYLTPTLLITFIQCQYCFIEDVERAAYCPKEPTVFKKQAYDGYVHISLKILT